MWEQWLPAKYRDRGPKVVRRGIREIDYVGTASYVEHFDDDSPTKVDCWLYEDLVYTHKRMVAAVGYPKEEMTLTPITYDDMRPGCYDPKARLADMDVGWVEASMCFPTLPRFCGQTFLEGADKDLGLACVKAYNDWMVEEWCGGSGGRLIPLGIIPLWDVDAAVAEVRRNSRVACARCASASCRITSACPRSTAGTGTRSSRRVPTPARWSRCTSVRRRRCRPPRPTRRRR